MGYRPRAPYDARTLAGGGELVMNPYVTSGSVTFGTGILKLVYVTPTRTEDITQLQFEITGTAYTTATLCKVGVFTLNSTGDGTLVSQSASSTTGLTSANTVITRTLSTTWNKYAGLTVALGLIVVGSGTATMIGNFIGSGNGALINSSRYVANLTGQTDMPSSFTASSLTSASTASIVQFAMLP